MIIDNILILKIWRDDILCWVGPPTKEATKRQIQSAAQDLHFWQKTRRISEKSLFWYYVQHNISIFSWKPGGFLKNMPKLCFDTIFIRRKTKSAECFCSSINFNHICFPLKTALCETATKIGSMRWQKFQIWLRCNRIVSWQNVFSGW